MPCSGADVIDPEVAFLMGKDTPPSASLLQGLMKGNDVLASLHEGPGAAANLPN